MTRLEYYDELYNFFYKKEPHQLIVTSAGSAWTLQGLEVQSSKFRIMPFAYQLDSIKSQSTLWITSWCDMLLFGFPCLKANSTFDLDIFIRLKQACEFKWCVNKSKKPDVEQLPMRKGNPGVKRGKG